jgi:hypothetical protein
MNMVHFKHHNEKKIKVKIHKYIFNPSSIMIIYYLGFVFIDIVFGELLCPTEGLTADI